MVQPATSQLQSAPPSRFAVALLAVLCAASFVLTTSVNRAASQILAAWIPRSVWYAHTCLPSALAALALYLLIRPARPFAMPDRNAPWTRMACLSSIWMVAWLLGLLVAALSTGTWTAYATGTASLIAFLLLGPLGEELLFRGAIFELTERVLPSWPLAPALLSSFLFSAHHWQLHGFALQPAALLQMAYTLPMGLVFARLRMLSRSIWPAFLLHILTNLPAAFGPP